MLPMLLTHRKIVHSMLSENVEGLSEFVVVSAVEEHITADPFPRVDGSEHVPRLGPELLTSLSRYYWLSFVMLCWRARE